MFWFAYILRIDTRLHLWVKLQKIEVGTEEIGLQMMKVQLDMSVYMKTVGESEFKQGNGKN